MTEYIDKQETIKKVCERCNIEFGDEPCEPSDCSILKRLLAIPAADVALVRHGRWVAETERTGNYAHCSMCSCRCRGYVPHYKYCPNCGARMEGGADNGE